MSRGLSLRGRARTTLALGLLLLSLAGGLLLLAWGWCYSDRRAALAGLIVGVFLGVPLLGLPPRNGRHASLLARWLQSILALAVQLLCTLLALVPVPLAMVAAVGLFLGGGLFLGLLACLVQKLGGWHWGLVRDTEQLAWLAVASLGLPVLGMLATWLQEVLVAWMAEGFDTLRGAAEQSATRLLTWLEDRAA